VIGLYKTELIIPVGLGADLVRFALTRKQLKARRRRRRAAAGEPSVRGERITCGHVFNARVWVYALRQIKARAQEEQ
jgi:hypothetical protein